MASPPPTSAGRCRATPINSHVTMLAIMPTFAIAHSASNGRSLIVGYRYTHASTP